MTLTTERSRDRIGALRSRRSALPRRLPTRTRFAALWPEDDFETTPEMNRSIAWTNWPLFTVGMVQRGIKDDDIRKILGGNVLRVARAALA